MKLMQCALIALSILAPQVAEPSAPPAQGLVAPGAPDTVVLVDRNAYYGVRGTTAQTLAARMTALGPKHLSGRRAWGFTAWEIRMTYELTPTPEGCAIANPRATVEIVTTLPRLEETRPLPQELQLAWGRMLASMVVHESVHRDHGISAARNAVSAVEGARPHLDCTLAEHQVDGILRREADKARKLSEAFDLNTSFGAKDGVRLGMRTRDPYQSTQPMPLPGDVRSRLQAAHIWHAQE